MDEVTGLQLFAESVVADVLGVSKEKVREAVSTRGGIVGFDPIALMAFIQAIMAMIAQIMQNCPAPTPTVREYVKRPTFWQQVQVLVAVRRNAADDSCVQWRRQARRVADSLLKVAAAQSDETIDSLIEQARSA